MSSVSSSSASLSPPDSWPSQWSHSPNHDNVLSPIETIDTSTSADHLLHYNSILRPLPSGPHDYPWPMSAPVANMDPPKLEGGYSCPLAHCTTKPFKRLADLNRHRMQLHPDLRKGGRAEYRCDYQRCPRRVEPFHRRDHFRDHLREYHQEDISKRGKILDEEWLWRRNISCRWWRCSRCLIRVPINGGDALAYSCPSCKAICEEKRRRIRDLKREKQVEEVKP